MSDDKKRILEMLSQGKLTVDEAERLLKAMDEANPPDETASSAGPSDSVRRKPRFLCVKVEPCGREGESSGKSDRVDVRIPLGLVRAGIKLGSVMPEKAKARINAELGEKGIDIDIDKMKGKDLEEVLAQLCDANIDIQSDNEIVRIYCE